MSRTGTEQFVVPRPERVLVEGLGRPDRVLVIDDDADLRAMLDLVLQRAGFEVFGCSDGSDALAAALALLPSAVVLDWVLPTCSGLAVCGALRSRPELDATRIVMVSARDHQDDVQLGYSAGADRYLAKPIRPRLLVEHLRELTRG